MPMQLRQDVSARVLLGGIVVNGFEQASQEDRCKDKRLSEFLSLFRGCLEVSTS